MECYYFCRQCEDHFETAGATGHKRVPFAASFLRDRTNFRWQQHKRWEERDRAASLNWDKFKAFLQQSLGESTAFVNSIWSKIKRDSQYQQEEVQDWASHLLHLQSVLVEFDTKCAPAEDVLCRYFYEGLRPSIRLWINKEGRKLDGWNALIKKATRAEAKAKMQASISRDIDQQCHRSNRPMHTTAAKAQAQTMKDLRVNAGPKSRAQESVGVTYQPLRFAPSIKYLSCLISISFRRSSASFPVFMCRVQCTPSIDHLCSEHQTPHLFIHVLEPLGSDIHVLRPVLLRASSATRHLAPTFMS